MKYKKELIEWLQNLDTTKTQLSPFIVNYNGIIGRLGFDCTYFGYLFILNKNYPGVTSHELLRLVNSNEYNATYAIPKDNAFIKLQLIIVKYLLNEFKQLKIV